MHAPTHWRWLLLLSILPFTAQAQTNTLVTGVVTDQHGQVVDDPLEVRIAKGNDKLATVQTRNGLFTADVKDMAAPEDELTITIRPQSFELGKRVKARKYGPAEATCRLATAQNIQLKLDFEYVVLHPEVGPFPNQPTQ